MDESILLIILTENVWLHLGLSYLFPEVKCLHLGFSEDSSFTNELDDSNAIIAIDSLIFLKGEWKAYNSLKTLLPEVPVIWLLHNRTGKLFPRDPIKSFMIDQKKNVCSIRYAMLNVTKRSSLNWSSRNSTTLILTSTERRLLTFFMAGVSVPIISRNTGMRPKNIYYYRKKIMEKMGFKQMGFLQLVCIRNSKMLGLGDLTN